jgi:hypothetical protein
VVVSPKVPKDICLSSEDENQPVLENYPILETKETIENGDGTTMPLILKG